MAPPSVFQLSGTCNNYPWGKKGKQSLAAQLCAQTPGTGFQVDDEQPYSEMWFGDYPDFPARKLDTGEPLADVLAAHKDQLLGPKVLRKYDAQLPYLPKILSIAKALPLQLHPNKELATKLHEKDPQQFTDPNHKPEIAVALSTFEFFAGFKPLARIEPVFKRIEALRRFVPAEYQAQDKSWTDETLRSVTRALLKADLATVKQVEEQLGAAPRDDLGDEAYALDLLPRLQGQYGPEDAGSLVALLCLNFFVAEAGDAVYIPADGVHAYLSGDIVECMARSNNVLNAGFCPPGDRNNADLFADTLTFKAHSRDDVSLPSEILDRSATGKTRVYRPPMSEFDMIKAELGPGATEVLPKADGPGVMIVTKGHGLMKADGGEHKLQAGFIYYVAPNVAVRWEAADEGLQIHMAIV